MAGWSKFSALLALAAVGTVHANSPVTNLFVDGVNQGDGVCVRMGNDVATAAPLKPKSKDIVCGANGNEAVASVCPANAGSILTTQFSNRPGSSLSGSFDLGKRGPCAVYMKKVNSAAESGNATPEGWFKIWEFTYDKYTDEWCTDRLIANDGYLSFKVPNDIVGGNYLLRTEVVGFDLKAAPVPEPDIYVNCVQILTHSTATAKPTTVSINEHLYDIDLARLQSLARDRQFPNQSTIMGPPVYQSRLSPRREGTAKPETPNVAARGVEGEEVQEPQSELARRSLPMAPRRSTGEQIWEARKAAFAVPRRRNENVANDELDNSSLLKRSVEIEADPPGKCEPGSPMPGRVCTGGSAMKRDEQDAPGLSERSAEVEADPPGKCEPGSPVPGRVCTRGILEKRRDPHSIYPFRRGQMLARDGAEAKFGIMTTEGWVDVNHDKHPHARDIGPREAQQGWCKYIPEVRTTLCSRSYERLAALATK
ncbi:hypothetical protein AJ80_04948 [Polytolypa hystricis UAMH7299]|uniref:AA9 family lytic polysaccharide monooxygenase n=1 Tax=Polytolypa hystricis (strain UAMH7299) TaxID=1447883 RepID=A0A2B7Y773_POLH7|nr:hypothetical protein AJ80_04948 [Polytolypa hystricis UAMH7299]